MTEMGGMNVNALVAIDVHTHAWKSALAVGDTPTECSSDGNYFRYVPSTDRSEMERFTARQDGFFVGFTWRR